jgi:NTE family protein
LVSGRRVARVVEFMIEDRNFESCQIPFACVATDLVTGEEVIFRRGSLRQAVAASMSIPGFLPPVRYDGRLLVDGAVVAPVPINACRLLGADVIIAVDVSQPMSSGNTFENVVDIIFRSNSILSYQYKQMLLDYADVVISPNVGEVHWSDFQNVRPLVAEGERAAQQMLPQILQLFERKQSIWRRLFGS